MKTALKAGLLYFLAVMAAGVVFGTVRVLWIVPQLGTRAAELVEMPFMLAVILIAARSIVTRVSLPPAAGPRLAMGLLAVALVLATELGLVLRLRGISFAEYRENLDPVSGSVYYALLAFFAVLPLLIQNKRWYTVHATAWGAVALAAVFFGLGYTGYLADLERAGDRVALGGRLIATDCGPIEYAEEGTGPAVLLVHGAGGGYDQGLEFGAELASRGFRTIAMSRFGYLRTPLPANATPEAQADAHACLLDALKISDAAIVGVSAGAPSSLQFALRHPARTRALVLLVPLAYAPRTVEPPSPLARFMYERATRSDFLYWLALRIAPGIVVKTILATPPEVLARARSTERERVEQLMEHILPLSRRQAGLLNDAAIAQHLPPWPLVNIRTPTLVISLADDLYGTYESAGFTAAGIPGARFIGYNEGGHVWVGHHEQILAELESFLSGAAAPLARR